MAIQIGIGGGQTVEVQEPTRGQFEDNLRGAFVYGLSHLVYDVLEGMGSALGAFAAGFLVQFLERLEPELIVYAAPLIDLILGADDLPTPVRTFLTQLKTPTDPAGAALLIGLGTQAAGQITGSVLNSLLSPVTYFFNRLIEPARPTPGEAWGMYRFGTLTEDVVFSMLEDVGFSRDLIREYREITRSRPGAGDVIEGWIRGTISPDIASNKLRELGLESDELNLLRQNARQLFSVSDTFRAWYRGTIDIATLDEKLRRLGFSNGDINRMKVFMEPLPGPSDLITMGVREAWRDDIAARYGYDEDYPTEFGVNMALHGFDPVWAKRYWRAHWDLPSVQMGYEMLHRGIISSGDLDTLLKISDIPAYWRDRLIQVSYRPFTRVDVRRMYGLDVLDREGVKLAYLHLGYDPEKAEAMTEFTVRYEDSKGESRQEQFKEITAGQIIKSMRRGITSREEAVFYLTEIGYHQEDAEFLVDIEVAEQEADYVGDVGKEYHNFMRRSIEAAYRNNVLTLEATIGELTALGYTLQEATLIVNALTYDQGMDDHDHLIDLVGSAYTRRFIERDQAIRMLNELNVLGTRQGRVLALWDADRDMPRRRLSEAQYRRALGHEIIDTDDYRDRMRDLGYTQTDIEILVTLATE